jgi:hypothetical protein
LFDSPIWGWDVFEFVGVGFGYEDGFSFGEVFPGVEAALVSLDKVAGVVDLDPEGVVVFSTNL